MFARILVATDFSGPSDAPLAQARLLANATGATLHVLHVVDNMFLRAVLGDPRDYETAARRQLQDRISGGTGTPPAILAVERSDEPADEITSYARTRNIDLIVMGTHGRGRMAHLLLGSVAEKVARTAPCPVLTMREDPPAPGAEGPRILVPTDFSECSDAALDCARRLARQVGGSLRLVHVMDRPVTGASFGRETFPEPAEEPTEQMTNARTQLSNRVAGCRQHVPVASDIVFGPTAGTITAYAHDSGFDLIVMGTHGRRGLAHLIMGSVAESVIRTASCPVLTVRSPGGDQAQTMTAAEHAAV